MAIAQVSVKKEQCPPCPPGKYWRKGTIVEDCEARSVRYLKSSEQETNRECSEDVHLCTDETCPKGQGHYCPQDTQMPIPCANGKYNEFTAAASVNDCLSCSPGGYCNNGAIEEKYCEKDTAFPEQRPRKERCTRALSSKVLLPRWNAYINLLNVIQTIFAPGDLRMQVHVKTELDL